MGLYEFDPREVPAIRIAEAVGRGREKHLLFVVGGGLGDRVCAEPVLRYATKEFPKWGCEISLCCDTPELFLHLKFEEIYTDPNLVERGKFIPLYTYSQGLANQFLNANLMHGVDFAAVSAIRGQVPDKYRAPRIIVPWMVNEKIRALVGEKFCLLHVGKSWPSRTFPKEWWTRVIVAVYQSGRMPVLIGKNCVEIPEWVFIDTAIDLREKTNFSEFVWLCKQSHSIITNDSSPLHFGATGEARIAFVATCRRPEFLYHHRGECSDLGWRMRDFSVGKMWEHYQMTPNDLGASSIAEPPPGRKIEEFLPDPQEMIAWIEGCP